MDVPDDNVLDVDLLPDDGSEDEGEAPPSSEFYPGPGSTPTSCASSPRGEEPASPHGMVSQPAFFHHQGYTRPFFTGGRRGPGRPRKDGPKLTREGKIVRRYRGTPGSLRGAKRHRGSRDEALDDMMEEDDFTMPPAPEEPPYMPEKWPGKVCALCNLSERSQLGQGEMRQLPCNGEGDGSTTPIVTSGGATPTSVTTPSSTPSTPVTPGLVSPPPELVDPNQHPLALPLSRRQKAFNKCKTPLYNMEHTDELSIIGHIESLEIRSIVSSSMLYIHRLCLEFTPPFQDQVASASSSDEDKEQLEEARVKGIVAAALTRKCAFCTRHGACIPCKMSCSKYFHLPCILASGGFIDFQTKSSFCKDHLYQVPLVCSADIECRTCRTIGDIANLMTCVTCGAHHHGTCVGLPQLPGVRSGWACRACRVCQVCRGEAGAAAAGEARSVACEHCDKLYHAACLRPVMATVPKYGWKCKCCRVCSDCGARSPGAGPSSRWHAHYTVCDSCYQQRNKGSCCPLCRRAYRAAAYRDMIRCTLCKRYVHGMCDPDAEPAQYRQRKEQTPSYEYCCPICKTQMPLMSISKSGSFEEDNMASTSQDSSFGDESSQTSEQDPLAIEAKPADVGLGKGKPFTVASKVAKKKIGGYKLKGGFPTAGKLGFQKRQRSVLDFGRKRGSKPKMRGVFGVPGLGLQRPQAPDNKTTEDDPGVENKLVLCSSKDKFVLTQDVCVMCGAVGTDSEGCLISCAQCGQTYHPYCVNIKVSQVIVTLGWRCLDCTVCEGCGNRGDDTLLLLCDDCDTAWHTYCARPQLSEVPRGAWRCERCRRCLVCGTRDTIAWCDNYTECAPCASLVMCCVCSEPYSDGELIIQCETCNRWLHASCDAIRSENDAEVCCRAGYKCVLCRGREVPPPHMSRAVEPAPAPSAAAPRAAPRPTPLSLGLAGEYYVDDVCLSQRGAHHMKQLEAEMGITHTRRKRRFKNENADKDAVVQNADVEMTDDAKPDSTAEVKEEPATSNTNCKEGSLWNVANDGPPPEGFTLYTTDTGLTVLRRKRQRNLNKLGIGGFVVRQRQATIKAQADEEKEGDGTHASGESPSNKRKPRRKPRSKLMEQFPPYMQEAFFGKDLLEPAKPAVSSTGNPAESPGGSLRAVTPEGYRELRDFKIDLDNSDSEGEDVLAALTAINEQDQSYIISLNQEEVDFLNTMKPRDEKDDSASTDIRIKMEADECPLKHTEDSTALKNAILGPQPAETEQAAPAANDSGQSGFMNTKTETISETGGSSQASTISPKDDLSLLGVNLDAIRDTLPDMDSNDVDEIFKGVLTDDSQESQESSVSYVNSMASTPYSQQRQQLQSPMDTYASPYHTDFGSSSNSALSPLFSEGNSGGAGGWGEQPQAPPPSYNQRSAEKMRADETLGSAATISAVLYANTNHPEWKTEFPNWVDRCKQILKKWRALPSDQKSPYLQRARDNRSAIRMKKAQQSTSGESAESVAAAPSCGAAAPREAAAGAPPAPAGAAAAGGVRAPNVTVTAAGLLEADAHIRVLTPSEIMRTLPRLAAPPAPPATPPPHTEQDRTCGQQRSAREAEQERAWKNLQQQRQQQTQQQQQIIHDQRMQAAMQRLRAPDGSTSPGGPGPGPPPGAAEAPRSAFPAARFPLHCAGSEDINRQLRDLLQRHPDKWPQQGEGLETGAGPEGQQFRPPLPVGMRPRHPMLPSQRPEQHLIMHQRIVSADGQMQQNMNQGQVQQQVMEAQKTNVIVQPHSVSEPKQEVQDHGTDEMDMGDMDKLEQDTGNIGEVGDILTGLGGEDDEELLESLTAEIGEQFNILEYADPELANLNDAEHILDGLELADEAVPERHAKREPEDEHEQHQNSKMYNDLQKAVKNIESTKTEVKSEIEEVKTEIQEVKQETPSTPGVGQMYEQRVITPNQHLALQNAMQAIKSEVKLEGDDKPPQQQHRPVFMPFGNQQRLQLQHQQQQQSVVQRAPQFQGVTQQRPQMQFPQHNMHFTQGSASGGSVTQSAGVVTPSGINTQSIVNAMTAQVQAALAAGRCITPGTRLVGADGAVGVVRADRSVALSHLPYAASGGPARAPPPPPYPGTLRPPQPPPPYPQEQPLLLEELLEQEKREQERDGSEWGGGAAPALAAPCGAPPPPAVPLYAGAPPPQPPAPPDRAATDADHHARLLYEQWLKKFHAFAADQQRYYEAEVQKLRKIRKSLNSKQRQLRKSGNELMPNDAAELQRVSTEQQALQKHLEAARKQARQHSMLVQEYETKQRQQNPQLAQQTVISPQNPSAFTLNQGMTQTQQLQQQQQTTLTRPMQLGLQGASVQQQQTLIRTQQTVIGADGQALQQQRIGLVTSPLGAGRLLQGGRTLVIEQTGAPQQLVRQLPGAEARPQGLVQFGGRGAPPAPRQAGARPAMSPLHVQSAQSPLHSLAPQSPLHHLTSPLQSPLHSQQSPLHHTSQSPLHSSTQSPLHSQQSPMHVQQTSMPQQSPLHPQQSPMHPQQSPMHPQQSPMHPQQSPMHPQQSPMHPQQSPMHQQQSPMHPQQSPMHPQQSPMHSQQSQMSQHSPMHSHQSPMHMQQSPMHMQQSPMHTQQSPMQSAMSPQHFLQQLQAQRTSPQLPTPSRSPQIYQQSQIQSPVASNSPQLQNTDYNTGRFPRPAPGCSPLPSRFARPPHHQAGMRVGGTFGGRQQTSPLGSPQPMPSPGNPNSELARQQMVARQQYSPMGGAPASPSVTRSPHAHAARTPTPAASPAASPAPHAEHGGGGALHQQHAPLPPGYRYRRPGLRGGAPPAWLQRDDERRRHITKVSILKRRRFAGKTIAPDERADDDAPYDALEYAAENAPRPERIATEEDFEELIDGGAVDEPEAPPAPRTETATKTVAVISLSTGKPPAAALQQYKLVGPARLPVLNTDVSQATVASVSIANQTISVPVLKSLAVPGGVRPPQKQVGPSQLGSVIGVISSSGGKVAMSPVIALATSAPQARLPVSMLTHHQVKQKIVKTIERPMALSLGGAKLSSLAVTHDATLPAKIFQDEAASPDSTVTGEAGERRARDLDIETEISRHTELPHALCLAERALPLGRADIKSPDPVPEKIPDNIMEGDDDDRVDEEPSRDLLLAYARPEPPPAPAPPRADDAVPQTIKAIANQTKAISYANATTEPGAEVAQESVQISIPSPTPSQERYLDDITMREHAADPVDAERKRFEDMLCMLDNIDDNDPYKHAPSRPHPPPPPHTQPHTQSHSSHAPSHSSHSHQLSSHAQLHSSHAQTHSAHAQSHSSHAQSHLSHAQTHLSHALPHSSHAQPHSSHAQPHSSHALPHSSHALPHSSHALPHSSHALPHSSHAQLHSSQTQSHSSHTQPHQLHTQPHQPQAQLHPAQRQGPPVSAAPPPAPKEQPAEPSFPKREGERLALAGASIPQLSPLSQPAELTSNMANVSQQLRTIMSSLNTNTQKVEPTNVIRKNGEPTAPTQVNFENLLPSSKVEVATSRPSPAPRDKLPAAPDPPPMSAAHALGSRVNTLSSMGQMRKSPTMSPISSPVGQNPLIKSPAHPPPTYNPVEDAGPTSSASQIIQMPALSRIQSGSTPPSIIHTNNTITTSMNSFQKSPVVPTSILGHTLLQPTRQMNTSNLPANMQFSQQSISSSQPPALVMTSRPLMGNKEVAPNVTVRTHTIVSPGIAQMQGKQAPGGSINFINTSKLLHTQLTSPLKRSKSTDEPKSEVIVGHIQPTKRHSVEAVVVKSEPMETEDPNALSVTDATGNKVQQGAANQRNNDESQNVLLKQLLQTTTTAASVVPQRTMTIQRTAPALGTIPSLEAQLARPSIPPPTLALAHDVDISKASPRHITAVSTTFAARPMQTSIPTSTISQLHTHTTQSLMDVRKPPLKIVHKEEQPLVIHAPLPETSPTMKSMQMYPMSVENQQIHQAIKKEIAPPQQSPVHRPFTPMDVKKELLDESSQQSATSGVSTASDQGKLDQPMKEEFPEGGPMDSTSEVNAPETPSEAKKRKRREYQQKKRKQMQMNMKAAAENSLNAANAKKRPRKGSKYEEDYDTFIDNLMAQLRLLPTMQIQEPALTTNFAVCPLFGSGDLTKLKNKDYDVLKGDLTGEFGNAKIPNVADYYNTKPFGDEEPLPEKPPASTQRGFYDQEFQPITFDEDPEDKKLDFICKERDTDTPDSIVSCSSPECLETEPLNRFPGLKLIDDEEEDEDSDSAFGRISPVIPIIAPVPIRLKPISLIQVKEEDENQKALKTIESDSPNKVKMEDSPGSTESNENVTVTLTLTSGAAEDILGVLKELAGILHIPPPTAYQIIERTATPPSHKLGLYRSKGKDGKEGTPIDIQSILNGAAKFCRHCDVVILDSVVRAKASEFPLLSANKGNAGEILCDSDSELFFCSTQCYERFAWRPTNIILDGKTKATVKEDKSDNDTNQSKDRDDFDTASNESMETDDLDIKPDIKDEKMDLSFMDSLDNDELMKEVGDDVSALDEDLKSVEQDDKSNQSTEKEKYRGVRYKAWSPGCIGPPVKYKRPTDRELTELVFRTGVAIMPVTNEDSRRCELCGIQGDGVADGVSRLLNCDVDRWVHLNCALWSEGVYETVSGALMNVETALAAGSNATCAVCRRLGATVRCFKVRCGSVYHLGCAVKDNCVFYKNKTAFCASHAPKNEKDNELTTLSVQRRVYVSRDEQRQVASVMLHSDTNHLIRVGGLIFLSPGHLLPHQLAAFHTPNYIYPIGYKIVRFYWSMVRAGRRCRYLCWISEEAGRARFHVRAQDEPRHEGSAATPRAAWAAVLDAVAALREGRNEDGVLKLWPNYVTGEDLFGLTEPAVVRVLESLPGIETLTDYRFKFGRSALLEGGLCVNPSGCARAEPRARAAWRRAPRALAPTPAHLPAPPPSADHPVCPYTKQFIHTKSSQYKKMKLEWRNNVYLARSKIQGLGLYAARDLEKHTMVIEYIGEIIRSELSELREKKYEAKNRGIYMFRLDERRVVDATLSGGLARYINHSCQPNCVAETIEVDRHLRIIIFAKRRIARGEELAYDYKFDIEDDAHKIMCMCGAPNCRKWMN